MAQRKKRKRRVEAGQKKKAGVMIGMRSGFKKAATAVTGSEPATEKKKSSWVSTAITIALVLAALAILFYRNR
jgi:hypothetical protein